MYLCCANVCSYSHSFCCSSSFACLCSLSCCFQFCRFDDILQGLNTTILEMQQCAADIRKLSSEYQIRDFRPIHVHYGVLSNACFKYDQIAEKLEDLSKKLLVEVVAAASPPHEVQEEYLSFNIEDQAGSDVVDVCVSDVVDVLCCRCVCQCCMNICICAPV
jgi:hypothetical protein